jgi:release factor glutamine methyltransferase
MPVAGTDERTELYRWAAAHDVGTREARWILEHLEAGAGPGLDPPDRPAAFRRLVERRAAGEPLQYVLGQWPFRSIDLLVDRRVLIPRPETEQVVEVALGELRAVLAGPGRPAGATPICVDLGTGSGAIALALATEVGPPVPGPEVWATDRSAQALEVAQANLDRLSGRVAATGARVRLVEGSWWAALPATLAGTVDLVVANPPYVAEGELDGLDPEVREWEPQSALVARAGADGEGGMADIEAIVAEAPHWLGPHGVLVVEIAPHQADASRRVAGRAGFTQVRIEPDLAGRLRMLVARA